MDIRNAPAVVAANVAAAVTVRGTTLESLSNAAGIPASTLADHFSGRSEFTLGELQDVGGVLRFPVQLFFTGVSRA